MSVKTAYTVNRTDEDAVAFQDYSIKKTLAVTATGATRLIPIDAGKTVIGVRVRVKTVVSGTTPTVTVGDSATADGYLASGDVNPATLNAFANSVGLGSNAFAKGKYYSATDAIIVTIANSGGTTNSGELEVWVVFAGEDAGRRDFVK